MSLIVAQMLTNGGIAMVGDTKLLFGFDPATERFDEGRSRRVYEHAFPKIVILRDDLAVGVAGAGLAHVVEALVGSRHLPVDDLFDLMRGFGEVEFVVAALDPVRLWKVADGKVDDRSVPRRAWAGDEGPYDKFRTRETRTYPDDFGEEQRFVASMETVVHKDQPLTVGGYVLRLTTGPTGFRFVPTAAHIAPSHLIGGFRRGPGGTIDLVIMAPPGVDPTKTELIQFVGKPPTPGALALYVPPARTAWLFTQDQPWKSIPLPLNSADEVIQAAAQHGQRLSKCGCGREDH